MGIRRYRYLYEDYDIFAILTAGLEQEIEKNPELKKISVTVMGAVDGGMHFVLLGR